MTTFNLSVEEMAYIFGFLGGSEVAAGFLNATVGQLSPTDLTARLTAASHSLLARELLKLDLGTGQQTMDENLSGALKLVLTNGRNVRCTRLANGTEETTTYFLAEGKAVEHTLWQAVCSRIEILAPTDVPARVAAFVQATASDTPTTPLGQVAGSVLQQVRKQAGALPVAQMAETLTAAGLAPALATELATALSTPQMVWGTILLVELAAAEAQFVSNAGLFYALQDKQGWLFEFRDEQVSIYKASQAVASLLAQRLLTKAN